MGKKEINSGQSANQPLWGIHPSAHSAGLSSAAEASFLSGLRLRLRGERLRLRDRLRLRLRLRDRSLLLLLLPAADDAPFLASCGVRSVP
jgi:hypothetical protein